MIKRNVSADGKVQESTISKTSDYDKLGFVIPSFLPAFNKFIAYKRKKYVRFGKDLRCLVNTYADLYRYSKGDPDEAMRLANQLIIRRIYRITNNVVVKEGNVIKTIKI